VVTEVVPLKHQNADTVAERVRLQLGRKGSDNPAVSALPPTIKSIVEDARTNSLIITGVAEASRWPRSHRGAGRACTRLYVAAQRAPLDVDADGDWDVRVVGRPTITSVDDVPATISVKGDGNAFAAEITPHLNPDGTIGLDGSLRRQGCAHTFSARYSRAPRRSSPESPIRRPPPSARPLRRPDTLRDGEPFSVFFLQVISAREGGM